MTNTQIKKTIKVIVSILIALISVFYLSKFATSTDFHAKTIASLDEKKSTVLELTAASTAASAAVTLLPGDTATPIAEKLTDLSSYFLIVICAIFLEKYLLTITGYASFIILIPLACLLYCINVFLERDSWKYLIRKIAVFALAIVLVIPASVKVSDLIESTYKASIDEAISTAKETTVDVEKATEDEDEGLFSGLISKVGSGITDVTEKVQNVVNRFIEALAVMLVTSCVIPIVVLLFFVWLIKIMLGVDINLPRKVL